MKRKRIRETQLAVSVIYMIIKCVDFCFLLWPMASIYQRCLEKTPASNGSVFSASN